MAKDKAQVARSFDWTGILLIPFLFSICLIGLSAYVINPSVNPNAVLYYFIGNYLSPGIVGLLIAGILAIIMSTQDSYLNATSSLIARDVCKQIWPSLTDKKQLLIARISCFVITALSTMLAFTQNSILELSWVLLNFWDPFITIPLLAGLMGAKIDKRSFVMVIISSSTTILISRFIAGGFDVKTSAIGALTSALVIFIAHLKNKEPNSNSLPFPSRSLYARLRIAVAKNVFGSSSMFVFGAMALFTYTLSIFVAGVKNDLGTHLRIAAAVLCLVMLFKDLWSYSVGDRVALWFWNATLCFCLPFMASYFMFSSNYQYIWIAYFMLSLLLLYMLTNPILAVALAAVGSGIGYGCFIVFEVSGGLEYLNSKIFAIYSCIFVGLTTLLLLHNKRFVEKQVMLQLEDKVVERTLELESALAVKQGVLRNVSHEMRMPLQAISLPTDMLYEDIAKFKNKTHLELIKMLREGYDRLFALCTNLFDFIDFSSSKQQLLIQTHNLKAMAEEAVEEMVSKMKLPKVSKLPTIPEVTVKGEGNMEVECDRERIRQAIIALLSNAFQYGKGTPIEVEIKSDGHYIRFEIADRGYGVPEGELEKIFEPFEESSRTKSPAGGRGLGLAVCRKIVEEHKGRIWAENNEYGGASFYFVLPLEQKNKNNKK